MQIKEPIGTRIKATSVAKALKVLGVSVAKNLENFDNTKEKRRNIKRRLQLNYKEVLNLALKIRENRVWEANSRVISGVGSFYSKGTRTGDFLNADRATVNLMNIRRNEKKVLVCTIRETLETFLYKNLEAAFGNKMVLSNVV